MNTKWLYYGIGVMVIGAVIIAVLFTVSSAMTVPMPTTGNDIVLVRHVLSLLENAHATAAWKEWTAALWTGAGFLLALSLPAIGLAVLLYKSRNAFEDEDPDTPPYAGGALHAGEEDFTGANVPKDCYAKENLYRYPRHDVTHNGIEVPFAEEEAERRDLDKEYAYYNPGDTWQDNHDAA